MSAWKALLTLTTATATVLGGDPAPAVKPDVAGPAGVYQVTAPKPCRIIMGEHSVVIDWSDGPAPPAPDPVPDPKPPVPDPVPPPAPDPTPSPQPEPTTPLALSAKGYAAAVPLALSASAASVRTRQVTTHDRVVDYVAANRDRARVVFAAALDAAVKPFVDADGKITDPARYADALDEAAGGMK